MRWPVLFLSHLHTLIQRPTTVQTQPKTCRIGFRLTILLLSFSPHPPPWKEEMSLLGRCVAIEQLSFTIPALSSGALKELQYHVFKLVTIPLGGVQKQLQYHVFK